MRARLHPLVRTNVEYIPRGLVLSCMEPQSLGIFPLFFDTRLRGVLHTGVFAGTVADRHFSTKVRDVVGHPFTEEMNLRRRCTRTDTAFMFRLAEFLAGCHRMMHLAYIFKARGSYPCPSEVKCVFCFFRERVRGGNSQEGMHHHKRLARDDLSPYSPCLSACME